jgi:hypothetical protein
MASMSFLSQLTQYLLLIYSLKVSQLLYASRVGNSKMTKLPPFNSRHSNLHGLGHTSPEE